MRFPRLAYIEWAKSMPPAAINLARSGIEHCPPSLLKLRAADLVTNLPVQYGYQPLTDAIASRYRVSPARVFTVSGGTSFANYVACAAALDGGPRGAEAIVERPTYEPLVRIADAFGARVRRFDRRFDEDFDIDLDRFESLITRKTRLAIVSNLHNPSGQRIPLATLTEMAGRLARVGAYLLVDEVYLECMFGLRTQSCVHAGPNAITTNSLTKAYGLDGLRAGWILGSAEVMARARRINDLMTNNGVAPGERMALAAFRRLDTLARRARTILEPNLATVRRFLERETRLSTFIPAGGNVVFPRLPDGVDSDRLAAHLARRYSTLVVPGRFFDAPRHVRLSFGCRPALLARGLKNVSAALEDMR